METDDINEAVARKLGWVQRGPLKHDPLNVALERDGQVIDGLPHYATDIAAAWEIVEHLRAERMQITLMAAFDGFACAIEPTERRVAYRADTAPLAICKAFLKLP